jgi:signal peptidase I
MTLVAAPPPRAGSATPHRRRRALAWTAAIAGPLAGGLLAAAAFGVAAVQHGSMSPTLPAGAHVVFDRWTVPARGDIVLLVDREGWSGDPDALLVKRVVGVAGDVVACCEAGGGRLVVNGVPVDEPYAPASRPGGEVPFRVTVPAEAVWVMGDNRDASADSRLSVSKPGRGAVRLDDLRGTVRAWWVW